MLRRSIGMAKWIGVLLLCWQISALAVSSPVVMLQNVTQNIFHDLNKNLRTLRSSRGNSYIHKLINRKLIPHVAVNRMSMMVVGKRYWQQANSSQRKEFVNQFAKLIISTYSGALKTYDRDKLLFYRIGNAYKTSKYVSVRSLLVRKSGQKIPISYNLQLVQGRWMIYDFSIENVSIVQNYRAQFASKLRASGMAGLLQDMRRHNRNF